MPKIVIAGGGPGSGPDLARFYGAKGGQSILVARNLATTPDHIAPDSAAGFVEGKGAETNGGTVWIPCFGDDRFAIQSALGGRHV